MSTASPPSSPVDGSIVHSRCRTAQIPYVARHHRVLVFDPRWALMALMLVMGAASLLWMAALGAVMYYERVGQRGRALTPAVGVLLIGWGLLVAVHPGWVPGLLGGVAS